jgi:hypothetical protein
MYPRAMTAPSEPLARLAQYIERRITALALEYAEVCRLADISDETLSNIRKGNKARGSTYRKLERALQWQQGGIATILDGGEPTAVSSGGAQIGSSSSAPTLEQELELAGRLMAAQVRELGLSPEEADEAWRRAQERIAIRIGSAY